VNVTLLKGETLIPFGIPDILDWIAKGLINMGPSKSFKSYSLFWDQGQDLLSPAKL